MVRGSGLALTDESWIGPLTAQVWLGQWLIVHTGPVVSDSRVRCRGNWGG